MRKSKNSTQKRNFKSKWARSVRGSNVRSIDWYLKHLYKSRETIPLIHVWGAILFYQYHLRTMRAGARVVGTGATWQIFFWREYKLYFLRIKPKGQSHENVGKVRVWGVNLYHYWSDSKLESGEEHCVHGNLIAGILTFLFVNTLIKYIAWIPARSKIRLNKNRFC
jgi:hypothetical protein